MGLESAGKATRAKAARTAGFVLASVRVLGCQRRLLTIPAVATAACVLVLVVCYLLSVVAGTDENFRAFVRHPDVTKVITLGPRGTLLAAFAVLCVRVIQTFMQATVIAVFNPSATDAPASLNAAFLAAWQRRYRLLGWVVLSATVIVVANWVRSTQGIGGRFLRFLPRVIWAFASFFAIPVLMFEDKGPWAATRRSAALFRKAWGEETVATFSFVVIALPGVVVVLACGGLAWLIAGRFAAVFVVVPLWIAWQNVMRTLIAIFQVALYRYATSSSTLPEFARARVETAYGRTAAPANA